MTTPYKFNLYLSNGITKFKYIDERDKPLIDGEYDGLGIYKDTNEYIRLKIICKNTSNIPLTGGGSGGREPPRENIFKGIVSTLTAL